MIPLPAPPRATGHEAVVELRSARRRRRLGDTEWGELAYRVYTTALFCLVVAMMLSGWIGGEVVSPSTASTVAADGPGWAGLLLAVVVVLAVRSGGRGGPLALEAPDVHHLLLAPADRSLTLRRPSVEVLGYGTLTGAVVFGVAGSLLAQRLPGSNLEWVGCGVLFGVVVAVSAIGSALVTCSRRVPRAVPVALSWLLLAWSVAEVSDRALELDPLSIPTSPASLGGALVFWPLRSGAKGLPWLPVAITLAILGVAAVGGLSIESARRRTQLVGQLRFAVTVQDLRSVVLLRRQLASERPRNRRWFPVPRWLVRRFPVVGRDLQSVAHWPAIRVVRLVVLGAGAGLAVRAMWAGTTPLVLVAGVAAFVAALDALEPLAQEIDHPTLTASFPRVAGELHLRHLVAPCVVMLLVGSVGLLTAWAVAPASEVFALGASIVVVAAPAAVAGAAISVLAGSSPETSGALMTPEVAGPRLVVRTAWPPLVAMTGFLPAAIASRTDEGAAALRSLGVAVLLLVALVFGWVRFRDDIHRSMAESMGGGPRA
jgi:hypothetical protein